MPAAVLVGPEARHDVEGEAGHRYEAPEHGDPANLLVGRHLHGEELPPGPDEPAPPETGAGPDDDQLYPDQTPEVLRELGTRRVDAGRPGEARCIPRLPGSPRRTSSSRPSSRSGHSMPSPGRAHQLRFVLPSSPPLRVSLRVRILLSELRNEYRPSFDPTVVQVGDRLVDLAQRVEGDRKSTR